MAWAGVALVILAAFILVFFVLPYTVISSDVQPPARRAELENGVRSAAAQFLAGLVLATGLYFTARTLRLNREAQLTERFGRAIDQLGNEGLDVRLGGIYALERIARDSKRDHGPVMEVLTAYIRRYVRTEADPVDRAPYDVQAIVTVLGRRERGHEAPGARLSLVDADLRFVGLTGDLRNAMLNGANLADASVQADLARASLRVVEAHGAFINANLREADLSGAKLRGATMLARSLRGARYDARTTWPENVDPDSLGAHRLPTPEF